MKKLFRFLISMLVITALPQASYSQITKQDAIDLVVDTLFVNDD